MRLFAARLLLVCLFLPHLRAAQPVRARKAMVVSREANATDAGVAVLRAGGNAIDAAAAVGFALAVTHPSAGNIGGGGFLLVRFADGRTTFIDFRERAPLKSTRDMYLDKDGNPTKESVLGWRASGVPGTVRGLEYAHKKYGRAKWANVVAPSVKLAREGFDVSWGLAQGLRAAKNLAQFPESKRIFQNGGRYFEPGDKLVQPELAKVLERIRRHGAKDFYEGETARLLAAEMAKNGGEITLEDLKQYEAAERKPLESAFRGGYTIITAPPPSSGGIGILQMLAVLEKTGYEKHGAGSAQAIHFTAEAMRRYYADRAEHLGDPDFWQVPVSKLLSPVYVDKLRTSIDPEKATSSDAVKAGDIRLMESAETTHYSIVDAEGNAVAVTYTLNGGYGSGVTVPGLGILLNNEMDDFSVKPGHPNMFGALGGEANAIQPKKRPLSSMSPSIVLKNGKPFLVVGTPGGTRILTSVMQVIQNVVDFRMNVQDAVNFPRFHHQWRPDKLYLEPQFSPDTRKLLEQKGHALEQSERICEIAAIQFEEKGWLAGAADPRVEGKAAGY
ncbi:MAG: gamma-glutamyltransferase [Acidobacteria bacterium]|nr:gamma-glutamyltransferase [Acidobacteriota bacterium]